MTTKKKSSGCRVCRCSEVAEWLYPKEMMFGKKEVFHYFRCNSCCCLQLEKTPENISTYYPDNYYSLQPIEDGPISKKAQFKRRYFSPNMSRHLLGWNDFAGYIFCKFFRNPILPQWMHFLNKPISLSGNILDVGCGSGANLLALRSCGFTNLRGVDPYISNPVNYNCGVTIQKCDLTEVQGNFDLIMFHHVFEHLENPLETLENAKQLLVKGGQILIRIPLSDSFAADRYRENWVQLDAPRHITLQTRKSMALLAQKSGLKINRVVYDSCHFQFWGSEQYLRNIPLFDPRSYMVSEKNSIFSPDEIEELSRQSQILNTQERGDQAAFVLEV